MKAVTTISLNIDLDELHVWIGKGYRARLPTFNID